MRIIETVSGEGAGDGTLLEGDDGLGPTLAVTAGLGATDADGIAEGGAVPLSSEDGDGDAAGIPDGTEVPLGSADAEEVELAEGVGDVGEGGIAAPPSTGATAFEAPVPQPEAIAKQRSDKMIPATRRISTTLVKNQERETSVFAPDCERILSQRK